MFSYFSFINLFIVIVLDSSLTIVVVAKLENNFPERRQQRQASCSLSGCISYFSSLEKEIIFLFTSNLKNNRIINDVAVVVGQEMMSFLLCQLTRQIISINQKAKFTTVQTVGGIDEYGNYAN